MPSERGLLRRPRLRWHLSEVHDESRLRRRHQPGRPDGAVLRNLRRDWRLQKQTESAVCQRRCHGVRGRDFVRGRCLLRHRLLSALQSLQSEWPRDLQSRARGSRAGLPDQPTELQRGMRRRGELQGFTKGHPLRRDDVQRLRHVGRSRPRGRSSDRHLHAQALRRRRRWQRSLQGPSDGLPRLRVLERVRLQDGLHLRRRLHERLQMLRHVMHPEASSGPILCASSICSATVNDSTKRCRECEFPGNNCPVTKPYCGDDGICHTCPMMEGTACNADGSFDCVATLDYPTAVVATTCNTNRHLSCGAVAQCPGWMACENAVCKVLGGRPCLNGSDCVTGICVDGYCKKAAVCQACGGVENGCEAGIYCASRGTGRGWHCQPVGGASCP
jgi:hypothetical protein